MLSQGNLRVGHTDGIGAGKRDSAGQQRLDRRALINAAMKSATMTGEAGEVGETASRLQQRSYIYKGLTVEVRDSIIQQLI